MPVNAAVVRAAVPNPVRYRDMVRPLAEAHRLLPARFLV